MKDSETIASCKHLTHGICLHGPFVSLQDQPIKMQGHPQTTGTNQLRRIKSSNTCPSATPHNKNKKESKRSS